MKAQNFVAEKTGRGRDLGGGFLFLWNLKNL